MVSTGDEMEEPTVEHLLEGAEPLLQSQPAAQPLLEVEAPKYPKTVEQPKDPIPGPTFSEKCSPSIEFLLGAECHKPLEKCPPVIEASLAPKDLPGSDAKNHTSEESKLAVETHCEVESPKFDQPSRLAAEPLLDATGLSETLGMSNFSSKNIFLWVLLKFL